MKCRTILNIVANASLACFAFLPTVEASPVLYETATLIPSPPNAGYDLRDNQMAGARFTVTQTIEITAIGGQLFANQTLFGAIVALGVDELPMPNPGVPSALSGILAMTTFSTGSGDHTDFRTPLSLLLSPGTYGLVFGGNGSGLSGRMAMTGEPLPGAEIFINSGASWINLNRDPYNRMRFVFEGHAVPEPSTALLTLTVSSAFIVGWRNYLRTR